ncbi:MAG TPA: M13-type metalloendopeptidase [Woeseiaceae bacterium]|nr:M13-type metalloendopeptidase [Woeseiaceae bacterium]
MPVFISRRLLLLSTAAGAVGLALSARFGAIAHALTDPLGASRYGSWGFDLSGMDRSVSPGEDFYRFANGAWLRDTPIPADRSSFGIFYELRELVDRRIRAIVEEATVEQAAADQAGERDALVGAFYRSFMDEAKLEQRDHAPLRTKLAAIRAADTHGKLAGIQGENQFRVGGALFGFYVSPDDRKPTRHVIYGGHSSLGLPDREYYLGETFAEHRTRYTAYVTHMLELIDWPDAAGAARRILAYETEIAQLHWPIAERRDALKTYNATTFADLRRSASGFPWREFLTAAGLTNWSGKLVVAEASAIAPIASAFAEAPIATLQAWAAFQLADQAAPLLSPRFVEPNFDFRLRFLEGQPEQQERWKRGVTAANSALAHPIGEIYAELYFTPATKARMDELVVNLIRAMQRRIDGLSWMSAETRIKAADKLSKFRANIGYPGNYRSFAGLELDPADLFGNVERTQEFTWRWMLAKLAKPVDRDEWDDTPQTVNAYYRSTRNDITFPAGILQPPFFDPDADPAINYGAIGGVIGHEISHGFDDQGRRSDGDGVLRDWWTPEDALRFEEQAERLVEQYQQFELLPGARINGRLTLGENVADLAGLTIALEAYRASLQGRPAPVLDGFTGEQRVFLGWAQAWRAKYREPLLRQLIATDEHSPPSTRVNGVLRNMDAWYAAFSVGEEDPLYIAPGDRVRIW